jgi:hypothetical protein
MTATTTKFPTKEIPREHEEENNVPSLTIEGFDIAKPRQALEVANMLKKFVTEQQLVRNIQDRPYAYVEAWQFCGSQFGLYPVCVEVKNESDYQAKHYKWFDRKNNPKEVKTIGYKYRAVVEVRRYTDDKLLSRGEMICTNDEFGKHDFTEYAVLSMAQTRAEGKAWRMLLGWIMKAAGFEPTPYEEMDNAKKEFLENCPKPDEKRMLINLALNAKFDDDKTAQEQKKIEALALIAGCVDYDLFARLEARLRHLQPSIHETVNPSQAQINEHLRNVVDRDEN